MLSTMLFFVTLAQVAFTLMLVWAAPVFIPYYRAYGAVAEWRPSIVTGVLALLCKVFGY